MHGVDYSYRYGRTDTPTVGSNVAAVGGFSEFHGLRVVGWNAADGNPGVGAVRLGVPAQE